LLAANRRSELRHPVAVATLTRSSAERSTPAVAFGSPPEPEEDERTPRIAR
jgi:hypothetical protein